MPAREALLCGTPVIASDIAAVREATAGLARLVAPDGASIERVLREYPSSGPPTPRAWPTPLESSADITAERFAAVLETFP
jgi:hypothetical protein